MIGEIFFVNMLVNNCVIVLKRRHNIGVIAPSWPSLRNEMSVRHISLIFFYHLLLFSPFWQVLAEQVYTVMEFSFSTHGVASARQHSTLLLGLSPS